MHISCILVLWLETAGLIGARDTSLNIHSMWLHLGGSILEQIVQIARALLTMRHHPLHVAFGIGISLTSLKKLSIRHVQTLVLAEVNDGGSPHLHAVHMIRQINGSWQRTPGTRQGKLSVSTSRRNDHVLLAKLIIFNLPRWEQRLLPSVMEPWAAAGGSVQSEQPGSFMSWARDPSFFAFFARFISLRSTSSSWAFREAILYEETQDEQRSATTCATIARQLEHHELQSHCCNASTH